MVYHTRRFNAAHHRLSQAIEHQRAYVASSADPDSDPTVIELREERHRLHDDFQALISAYHRDEDWKTILVWHQAAACYMIDGEKVWAIKTIRQATGMGLKESKDLTDHFQHKLHSKNRTTLGAYDGLGDPMTVLTSDQREVIALLELAAGV